MALCQCYQRCHSALSMLMPSNIKQRLTLSSSLVDCMSISWIFCSRSIIKRNYENTSSIHGLSRAAFPSKCMSMTRVTQCDVKMTAAACVPSKQNITLSGGCNFKHFSPSSAFGPSLSYFRATYPPPCILAQRPSLVPLQIISQAFKTY